MTYKIAAAANASTFGLKNGFSIRGAKSPKAPPTYFKETCTTIHQNERSDSKSPPLPLGANRGSCCRISTYAFALATWALTFGRKNALPCRDQNSRTPAGTQIMLAGPPKRAWHVGSARNLAGWMNFSFIADFSRIRANRPVEVVS